MSDQTQDTAFSQNVASYIAYRLGVGCVVNPFTVKLYTTYNIVNRRSIASHNVMHWRSYLT